MTPSKLIGPFFACTVAASFVQAQAVCGNFEPGTLSPAELKNEFQGAVLRLQLEGSTSSGTGYLIDATQGYILTADHVVEPSTNAVVDVVSPLLPTTKLQAKVIKTLPPPTDLALLQLQSFNPTVLQSIRPLDITLRYPGNDATLFSMGYPKLGNEDNVIPRQQQVSILATLDDGSIEVKQTEAMGGASGGPLVDNSGRVIGTCRQEVGLGNTVARYAPMSNGTSLLDAIPMTNRMQQLDAKVKTGAISGSQLSLMMVNKSGNPTNVELYSWGKHIASHANEYSTSAGLLRCPVIFALMQRGMDDLVIDLSDFADNKAKGDANLHLAERAAATGQTVVAMIKSQAAIAAYTQASDVTGAAAAKIVLAKAQLDSGATGFAASNVASVLANAKSLPAAVVAEAYVLGGTADARSGNLNGAIAKYSQASKRFENAGDFSSAAQALTSTGEVHLQKGDVATAQANLEKAFGLYEKGNNVDGQSSTLYKLAKTQNAAGKKDQARATMAQYLALQPEGKHALEAKLILMNKPSF